MPDSQKVSQRTVSRLSEYRSVLELLEKNNIVNVYSHELARSCGVTAAQVRRDVMAVSYHGSSSKGYAVGELKRDIEHFLHFDVEQTMVLVGIGHLGRALLDFFVNRSPHLRLVAGFDVAADKVDRVIHGVRCYHLDEMARVVEQTGAQMGIITVPEQAAQQVAWQLVESGIIGLINFAPTQLRLQKEVHVEYLNLSTIFEKAAFFAAQISEQKR